MFIIHNLETGIIIIQGANLKFSNLLYCLFCDSIKKKTHYQLIVFIEKSTANTKLKATVYTDCHYARILPVLSKSMQLTLITKCVINYCFNLKEILYILFAFKEAPNTIYVILIWEMSVGGLRYWIGPLSEA